MSGPRKAVSVSLLGAGNWGTTLAHLIGLNGHRPLLWTRAAAQCAEINEQHRNSRYLPGLELSPNVRATTDLEEAIRSAELVLFVLPSQAFRGVCRAAGEFLRPEQRVIHATKGLEQDTHRRMSQLLLEETCVRQVGVLAGPNIAVEIAAGKPAGTVIASRFPHVIELGRRALGSERMMVFAGDDIPGLELASAFKNVIAIAAGIATEMGLGENAKALLETRGLAEIARLSVALGAHPLTMSGLGGVGDLMVTCASRQSRNHRVGAALARGEALPRILEQLGQVAEGVHSARAAHELAARQGLLAPVIDRVYRVLYEGLAPADGLRELMRQPTGLDIGRFMVNHSRSGE